jgi:hypothetical protein
VAEASENATPELFAAITGRNNVEVPDRCRTHICEMRSAFSDSALGPDQGVRGTRLIDGKLSSTPVLREELGQTSMTEPALPPGVRIRATGQLSHVVDTIARTTTTA